MLAHHDTLIAADVLQEAFVCDLSRCKGACCVEGDTGAPLTEAERDLLEAQHERIAPYMTGDSQVLAAEKGLSEIDAEGDPVTTCHEKSGACVYAFRDDSGVWKCAIEEAYNDGATDFRKPVSCHLYPVRLKPLGEYTAVNYDEWQICAPACELGRSLKVPVFRFVKHGLIRRFGQVWYDELDELYEAVKDELPS